MDFIEEYKKRLKKAIAAERTNREAAVLSLKMSDGQQWEEGEKTRRTQRGRPVLTGNLLEASIMQAVGDERHNHARVKVRPVSVQGDTKLAEIRAGIIAEAEYVSNAESIYDYAHEMQCRGAYGAWRVLTRYCADNPFMLNMTSDDAKAYAKAFYEKEYWDALGCDDLPAPLDVVCFDTAVNPGPSVARKILNETQDWKDFLFKRLFYYSSDVQAHPEKEKFFRGWVNRCLTLWGKNKG